LPRKTNGDFFELDDLKNDQKRIAVYIIKGVQDYCLRPQDFKPIRMTVMGMAGSGKTVMVKTLITAIRRIFQSRRSALVGAPTGAAAHNSGGTTLHRLVGVNPSNSCNLVITSKEKEKLVQTFMDTILLIVDERGMTDFQTLGKAESAIAQSTRDGVNCDKSWGGLPIVVLIGDDMQLPSVQKGTLFMPVGPKEGQSRSLLSPIESKGQLAFLEAAKDVMILGTIKRQDESEKQYKSALTGLRNDNLSEKDFKYLEQFDLSMTQWTNTQKKEIMNDAVFAFSTNKEVREKNCHLLQENSSTFNPVAKIQCSYPRSANNTGKPIMSHFKNVNTPMVVLICIGARVAINSKNFNPRWGLFNGSVGTVKSIIFAQGKSPNSGDMPEYVVVDIASYSGPAWDKDNPTVSHKCIKNELDRLQLTDTLFSMFQFHLSPSCVKKCAVKESSYLWSLPGRPQYTNFKEALLEGQNQGSPLTLGTS